MLYPHIMCLLVNNPIITKVTAFVVQWQCEQKQLQECNLDEWISLYHHSLFRNTVFFPVLAILYILCPYLFRLNCNILLLPGLSESIIWRFRTSSNRHRYLFVKLFVFYSILRFLLLNEESHKTQEFYHESFHQLRYWDQPIQQWLVSVEWWCETHHPL